MMGRLLATVALLMSLVWVFSTPVLATNDKEKEKKKGKKVEVLGYVKNVCNPIAFVPVTATCGTQTLTTLTGSTNGDLGKYSLTFNNPSCGHGTNVTVNANVMGNNFSNNGTVGNWALFWWKSFVDIQTGNSGCDPHQVPEFGMMTGLVAMAGSAGSFWWLRKRFA